MAKSDSQKKSQAQEKQIAKDVGGRVQPGSGAPDFSKGDVRKAGELLVEAKTTSKKSYALKLHDLQKVASEAIMGGMEGWAVQVQFQGQMGQHKNFAVIGWDDYLQLRADAKSLAEQA